MSEVKPKTWLCPICSLVSLPFGTTCPSFKESTCENEATPNATGAYYVRTKNQKREAASVGIARISDEE